jgi:hypothetical protein
MIGRISEGGKRRRCLPPGAFGLLLGLGSCLAPVSALAFRTLNDTPTFLGQGPVVWHATQVNLELPDDSHAPLPKEELRVAFSTAAAQWALGCSSLRFGFWESSVNPMVDDGHNSIEWVYDGWVERGFPEDAPALTELGARRTEAGGWEIIEGDIHLNAQRFNWSSAPKAGAVALLPVLAHELGHFGGLAHSCEPGGAESAPDCASDGALRSVLMNPAYSADRFAPTPDDAAGMCSLYPLDVSAETPNVTCASDEQCGERFFCDVDRCRSGNLGLGQPCDSHRQCASGACSSACVAACSSSVECASGDRCIDAGDGVGACASTGKRFGESCSMSEECISQACLLDDSGAGRCTYPCVSDEGCPARWQCAVHAAERVCTPTYYQATGGCNIAPAPRSNHWFWALAGLVLLRGRRASARRSEWV